MDFFSYLCCFFHTFNRMRWHASSSILVQHLYRCESYKNHSLFNWIFVGLSWQANTHIILHHTQIEHSENEWKFHSWNLWCLKSKAHDADFNHIGLYQTNRPEKKRIKRYRNSTLAHRHHPHLFDCNASTTNRINAMKEKNSFK